MGAPRWRLSLLAAGLTVCLPTAARASTGALTPIPKHECIGYGFCSEVDAQLGSGAGGLAESPDGKNVYATAGNEILAFSRDPATGALTPLGGTAECVREGGGSPCATGRGLSSSERLTVSHDGRNVYVAAYNTGIASGDVAVFSRDPATGALSQTAGSTGCLYEAGSTTTPDSEGCGPARGISGASDVMVSPDDGTVYVIGNNGLAVFQRDKTLQGHGALTQLSGTQGCLHGYSGVTGDGCNLSLPFGGGDSLATSSDGTSLYTSGGTLSSALWGFQLPLGSTPTGACYARSNPGSSDHCALVRDLSGTLGLAVSSDGKNVYVGAQSADSGNSKGGVVVLSRDTSATPNRGILTQLSGSQGCIAPSAGTDQCATGRALDTVRTVAVSPDGANVYAAAHDSDGVAVFTRDASTGALTQLTGNDGCVVDTADMSTQCASARALGGPDFVLASSDNLNVYVSSQRGIAEFQRAVTSHRLTVTKSKSSSGQGTVTSSPAGIICAAGCSTTSAMFVAGTTVSVTATPSAGSVFSGWSGGGCTGTASCPVTLNSDQTVLATFSKSVSAPHTKITEVKIEAKKHRASFSFTATGSKASGFQCSLQKRAKKHHKQPKPSFSSCKSPKSYQHLKPGGYTFEVRALNAAGRDPNPATKTFKIK